MDSVTTQKLQQGVLFNQFSDEGPLNKKQKLNPQPHPSLQNNPEDISPSRAIKTTDIKQLIYSKNEYLRLFCSILELDCLFFDAFEIKYIGSLEEAHKSVPLNCDDFSIIESDKIKETKDNVYEYLLSKYLNSSNLPNLKYFTAIPTEILIEKTFCEPSIEFSSFDPKSSTNKLEFESLNDSFSASSEDLSMTSENSVEIAKYFRSLQKNMLLKNNVLKRIIKSLNDLVGQEMEILLTDNLIRLDKYSVKYYLHNNSYDVNIRNIFRFNSLYLSRKNSFKNHLLNAFWFAKDTCILGSCNKKHDKIKSGNFSSISHDCINSWESEYYKYEVFDSKTQKFRFKWYISTTYFMEETFYDDFMFDEKNNPEYFKMICVNKRFDVSDNKEYNLPPLGCVKRNVGKVFNYRAGNCQELSEVAFYYLWTKRHPEIFRVERVPSSENDHAILVLNRPYNSSIFDKASWSSGENNHCYILDPWFGSILRAKTFEENFPEFIVSKGDANDIAEISAPFPPLESIPLITFPARSAAFEQSYSKVISEIPSAQSIFWARRKSNQTIRRVRGG